MKTAKPPVPEGATGSSRRAQPVRQTRANPPRTSSLNRANLLGAAPNPEQPINILPGVTHFADAITALPKELVRHFTLLKEVDAKVFAPEDALVQLLNEALNTPAREPARLLNDTSSSAASVSAPTSAHNFAAGTANPPAPASDGSASSVYDPVNIPRRTIFRDTALKIQEMLVSLEEKNHVIATANDALQKQLSRIEEIWPHLEAEFSDEAKWGSTTHWAYVENRQAKANDKQAERSRREGAATLSAAAQQLAEEAAARSSDRKQAMAAKKNAKNQATDADGDKLLDAGKKSQGAKSRKPLPDSGPVGLGIAAGAPGASANKRRKVEASKPNGGTPAERAMGSVYGNSAAKQRTTSPRETPAPEAGTKKRKALPTSSSQAKKSRTNAAMSPSVTSSPVIGTFPDPVKPGRGSPAPSATAPRPASSRARQNSTQSTADNTRQRPPPAASSKQNGNTQGTPDPGQPGNGATTSQDVKTQKEAPVPVPKKPTPIQTQTEEPPPAPEPVQNGTKKESVVNAIEELELSKREAVSLAIQPAQTSTVKTTKSGRASKPSTPAIATFAEAPSSTTSSSRSRPSRNTESSASTSAASSTAAATTTTTAAAISAKRSHKKGASVSATVAQAAAQAAQQIGTAVADKEKENDKDKESAAATAAAVTSNSINSSNNKKENNDLLVTGIHGKRADGDNGGVHDDDEAHSNTKKKKNGANDDEDEEEDEQVGDDDKVYCFCNQVSYGEMVACDGEGCPREWFHLECVGLKVAPKVNAKWFCEDCKKRLRIGERR